MRTRWLAVLVVAAGAGAAQPAPAAPVGTWTLGAQTRLLETFADGQATSPAYSLGFDARVELSRLLLDAAAGVVVPPVVDGALTPGLAPGAVFAHAAAAVLLNPADPAAVYLGVSVESRFHLAARTLALLLSGEVGLMLWRGAAQRLYVELRAGPNLLPVTIAGAPWGDSVYPVEVALGVGVGW